MVRQGVLLTAGLALMLGGCVTTSSQQSGGSCPIFGPKATVGVLGGAAAGAGLGAATGGDAKAIFVGAAIGALAGILVGGSLDRADCEQAKLALRRMDDTPTGTQIAWANPGSGNSGTFTPLSDTQQVGGRVCREYRRDIVMKDGKQTGGDQGIVCRNDQGDWEVVPATS